MTRVFLPIYLLLFLLPTFLPSQVVRAEGKIWVLEIDGAIGPATSDYFIRSLKEAAIENVSLIVLRINTPGGLDTAMRDMIQAIIASPIPVASYVAPSGARAASAGTYLLYASHVAAMAPGTNLGAATPVQIGGIGLPGSSDKEDKDSKDKKTPSSSEETMTHKIINDAEAYLRSLAQLRGRSVDWASAAVRESASLSAEDALKQNVVDLIATDIPDLLEHLQGRNVKVQDKTRQLVTKGLLIETHQPNWRTRFLSVITDPNIAYLLMLLGIYGLFFELYNPGSVVPGVVGGIALLLALLAFQALPINYAGLALILLGIAFMISEAFLPSFGVVGIGGIIAFAIGSVILIDNGVPGEVSFGISRPLIAGITLTTAAFFFFIIHTLVRIRSRPVVSGRENLIGAKGECLSNESGKLRVYVQSELWNAQASTPVAPGQLIKVTGINGLTLKVETLGNPD